MNEYQKLLHEKEAYKQNMQAKLKKHGVAINLSINAPGFTKNLNITNLLIAHIDKVLNIDYIDKEINRNTWQGTQITYYLTNKDPEDIKKQMIEFEDTHELGRFLDLDVYATNRSSSLSRDTLRKCYLCDLPAFVCQKNKTHTQDELESYYINKVQTYFNNIAQEMIKSSIVTELNLDPKFGLVTPKTSGSHDDMDYDLMITAMEAITPFLVKMFKVSYKETDIDVILTLNKQLGINAEDAMFKATKGVNCYKGLIFNLGLLITATTYYVSNIDNNLSLKKLVMLFSKKFFDLEDDNLDTFGKQVYDSTLFGGVRFHSLRGMPRVLDDKLTGLSDEELTMSLIHIIKHIEDSVFLKRSGSYSEMNTYQEYFYEIEKYDKDLILELTEFLISRKISFGGAADLLVCQIYLYKFNNLFSSI